MEAIEAEYPLLVEGYSLIGPVDHQCTFNGAGERFSHRPWGVFGGGEGASGRFVHIAGGVERALAIKPSGVTLRGAEKIVIESPGAGGYGPARERAPEALAVDLASGKFSAEYIKRHYPERGRATPKRGSR